MSKVEGPFGEGDAAELPQADGPGGTNENQQDRLLSLSNKKRWVHYGDPGYFDYLPPDLQYLRELPFGPGSIGFYPPPYEIDQEDDPDAGL